MNNQTHHRKSENCDSKSDFSSYHENLKNIEAAWENLFQRLYLVNQYPVSRSFINSKIEKVANKKCC